jgi:putative ABC transport system substrate-binding protein
MGVSVKLGVAKLVMALMCAFFAAPLAVGAQPGDKVYRIGFLSVANARGPFHQVFEQALAERGWVAGKNVIIEYRFAEEKYDRLPTLASELVRLEPQVIVAVPTASARAAKNATSTISIVMSGVADPISEGLIASFARPGGNVTGVTGSLTWATYAKQLQLLKDAAPSVRRIALLRDPDNRASLPAVGSFTEAAKALGVALQVVGARGPDEFEAAFREMTQARADALVIHREATYFRHLGRLADLAVRNRLPSICAHGGYAQAGGFLTYAVPPADEARQVAHYVDRLLRGTKPTELPVEQPTRFELIINLKTARALRVTIPPPLRVQADHVIE